MTDEAKHTPGPWTWDREAGWLEAPDRYHPDNPAYGEIVLEAAFTLPTDPDAHLIAAAPDMYEALESGWRLLAKVEVLLAKEELRDHLPHNLDEEVQGAVDRHRAALQKARGES